jgi:hypothetical protein
MRTAAVWIFGLTIFSIGVATGFFVRPGVDASVGDSLSFLGAIIGSGITVAGAIFLFSYQQVAADSRQLRTMFQLIDGLQIAGEQMGSDQAPLNPTAFVVKARSELEAAKLVSRQLMVNGPNIARAARLLEESDVSSQLIRLSVPGIGIATPDLYAVAATIVELASSAKAALARGL